MDELPRRHRLHRWTVAVAVPLIVVAGCTRPIAPTDDSVDTETVTTESATTESVSTESVATETQTESTAEPSSTEPGDDGDSAVASTSDDPGSTPATDEPQPVDTSPTTESAADDGSSDSRVVTIAAILGAGLLFLVAALWMVRMNRADQNEESDGDVSEPTPPDAPR